MKQELHMVQVTRLRLDQMNPRLTLDDQQTSQLDLARAIAMKYDAFTIASSIVRHGYFYAEPLIAIPDEVDADLLIVVEGNRRLTALLGLIDPAVRSALENPLKWERLASQYSGEQEFPVLIRPDRAAVAPLLGYRHISGIMSWDAYAQARFVASLIDDSGQTLDDAAELVGWKKTVARSVYRNYRILQQAKTAGIDTGMVEQTFGVFNAAMGHTALRDHISAPAPGEVKPLVDPIPADKIGELKEFCAWVFGTGTQPPVLGDSRQLNDLGKVLTSSAALAALRSGMSLESALLHVSQGPTPDEKARFIRSLVTAQRSVISLTNPVVADVVGDSDVRDAIERLAELVEQLLDAYETTEI
jgi:hypothetical protein